MLGRRWRYALQTILDRQFNDSLLFFNPNFCCILGGGFHGGNLNKPSEAGDGGTSYVDLSQSSLQMFSDSNLISVEPDHVPENGLVVIIPQIDNCCNDNKFPCLITGETINGTLMKYCVCGNDKFIMDSCICK